MWKSNTETKHVMAHLSVVFIKQWYYLWMLTSFLSWIHIILLCECSVILICLFLSMDNRCIKGETTPFWWNFHCVEKSMPIFYDYPSKFICDFDTVLIALYLVTRGWIKYIYPKLFQMFLFVFVSTLKFLEIHIVSSLCGVWSLFILYMIAYMLYYRS